MRHTATFTNGAQQMIYAKLGTISHGTLRTEDLLDTFASELEDLVQRNAKEWCSAQGRIRRDTYMELIGEAQDLDVENDDDDIGSELLMQLEDSLQDFAAPYSHFGSHEGDGSDYGFWPDFDALAMDDVLKVSDLAEVPANTVCEVMLVNDHGNVTLYTANGDGTFTELWSCV
jgi:hypothetical protein